MSFPKVESHELASRFNCEATLPVTGGSRAATPTGPRAKHRVQFVDGVAYAA